LLKLLGVHGPPISFPIALPVRGYQFISFCCRHRSCRWRCCTLEIQLTTASSEHVKQVMSATANLAPCPTVGCCHLANLTARSQSHWPSTLWFKKNAPTLADYIYDPVQSILIIFSKLFVNDHKSCLVVTVSTSPHICCHYTL